MKKLLLLGAVTAAVFAFCGCKEQGAGEKAGKTVDDAVKQTQEGVSDAADSANKAIQDAVKK